MDSGAGKESSGHALNEPNEEVNKVSKLSSDAKADELYPGCTMSRTAFVNGLLKIKSRGGWTDKSIDMLLPILNDFFPKGNTIPRSHDEATKIIQNSDINKGPKADQVLSPGSCPRGTDSSRNTGSNEAGPSSTSSRSILCAIKDTSQNVVSSNNKVKPRKLENYTVAEDILLIFAWENVFEDVIGTDQGKEQYWTRVWKEYSANAVSYPPRTEKSVQNWFSTIRTKCLKFSDIVQSIESSGMTEQDKVNMAIQAWLKEEKEKGGFKFLHCYNILKNSPKWITEVIHPATNKNTPGSDSINLGDDWSVSGHVEKERPIGRNAKKERQKKRKMEESGDFFINTGFRELQDLMQKMHEQKMELAQEDTRKMDYILEMKREKIELDRKTYEANREWREEKLMTVDMTNLTDMQRKFVEMKQTKIFERAFNSDS